MRRIIAKTPYTVSKKIPLASRPFTDIPCENPNCGNFSREGSRFCSLECGSYVANQATLARKRAERAERLAPPQPKSDPELLFKLSYIKYGVDKAKRERFKAELGIK